MKMNKDLIVFFSRSGRTRRLAEELAQALGADLEEIRERRGRAGMLGFLRSGYEAVKRIEPLLLPVVCDPRDYRRVFVGGPVWAGHPCSPVRAWLTRHRGELKDVAFFCTYGGRGAEAALAEMTQLAGRRPRTTLAVLEHDMDTGHERIAPFVQAVSAAA